MSITLIFTRTLLFLLAYALQSRKVVGMPPGTPMEDLLETQIDPRHPRSFQSFETMNVRQTGFRTITMWDKANSKEVTFNAGNWEKWATA